VKNRQLRCRIQNSLFNIQNTACGGFNIRNSIFNIPRLRRDSGFLIPNSKYRQLRCRIRDFKFNIQNCGLVVFGAFVVALF
jgi:hypothetical protein